ncbi:hypothetical protein GCM10007874_10590 [Labrys miyagiensis]|uniref:Uncharacterized protein n=1 Tax=Labrys miyagiensis TaxID=346912 RepID=A0ABQ6CCM9_9HYPH|nr:hypothetical protein [Labrys miyagiensis]GLS18043.1 hypothetical protein GCM10007874_10590 [Labrys miyagiensis]
MRCIPPALAFAATLCGFTPTQAAESKAFHLTPTLAHANVSHDPDGLWKPSDFSPFGNPPHLPSIYTATLKTPTGEWILSMLDNQCSPQSDCQAVLAFKSKDGGWKIVANPSLVMGGTATLSATFKTITTEEVDDSANGFTGKYDVGAP